MDDGDYTSWNFEEGEELCPGRVVLKPIGGGNRYEVCLIWDESLYALGVAKVLRPDQAEDEKALRDLGLPRRMTLSRRGSLGG